jgi:hypothetical protein
MDNNMLVPVEQALIPFYGNKILAVRLPDSRLAASLNSLCKMLKLARQGQMQRIRRDEDLTQYLLLALVQTAGGPQHAEVLVAEAIPAWVEGIQERLVAIEKRPLIRSLKIELIIVLYRHFFGGQLSQQIPEVEAAPLPPPSHIESNTVLGSLRERLLQTMRDIWEEEDARIEKLEQTQRAQTEQLAIHERRLTSLDRLVAASARDRASSIGSILLLSEALLRLLERLTGHAQAELEREMLASFRVSSISAIPGELWEDVLEWGLWRMQQPR